jgi:hypothetical protein
LRGRERLLDSSVKEKKSILTPILATKIIDFDSKRFYLMRRVPLKCFFTLELPKKLLLSSGRFFVLG